MGRGRPGVFDRAVFLGRRDEVVLRLLLDTGVRVSELCGLELTDVDLDRELETTEQLPCHPLLPAGQARRDAGARRGHGILVSATCGATNIIGAS